MTSSIETSKEVATISPDLQEMQNSLNNLVGSLAFNGFPWGAQLSKTDTLFYNNRWYLLSNFRQLLSELYVEHGIVQTLVDQPVDDAFRTGFEIKTGQLDSEEIEQLQIYLERFRVIDSAMQAVKWARLYGGGGVLILTDQDPATPLDVDAIDENSPLEFKAIDMWELTGLQPNREGEMIPSEEPGQFNDRVFNYYGIEVHSSRILRISGKQAPSFIRPRLQGWGMSELERLVRSINQYLKNQDVVFELLDEAKVDVWKIKGFNTAMLNKDSTQGVSRRIQAANAIKNFNNAVTMDKEDEYDQKQIQFTGLSDMLIQIRQGICADLKMPVTKLFGVSAAGFNSGEDDIENYNSMLEGEIRSKVKFIVLKLIDLSCRKLFGFVPDDLMISFNPLRILSAKEEEEVKDMQFKRLQAAYMSGAIDRKTWGMAVNKDSLLGVEVDENAEALPPVGSDPVDDTGPSEDKP